MLGILGGLRRRKSVSSSAEARSGTAVLVGQLGE